MTILIKVLKVTLLLFVLMSFSMVSSTSNFVGTYGVTPDNPNVIELTLKEDFSFTYKDFTNPQKKIDTQGKWTVKNGVVLLKPQSSAFSFHHKWKINEDGTVAKSRKGMTFYTLMKL